MSDEFLKKVDETGRNFTGSERSPEAVIENFALHGAYHRVAGLEQISDHLRTLDVTTGEASLRDYARLMRIRRGCDRAHQALLRVGR